MLTGPWQAKATFYASDVADYYRDRAKREQETEKAGADQEAEKQTTNQTREK